MEKKITENKALGEKLITATAKSGLRIYIVEKPDFTSSFAIFGTSYGSIDTRFTYDGKEINMPEGIAHYLEHKLFESKEQDAFERFTKTGAQANAYTSFDRTCYLFGCSKNFYENLDILLDFVRKPYFTAETVQKEQGIIGQEIRMYDDVPGWKVMFEMLRAMYKNHPVRIDIAGTVESISHITAELLYDCYNKFYSMSNMFLCVAGNVDAEKILEKIENTITEEYIAPPEKGKYQEPDEVQSHYVENKMAISQPAMCFGIKEGVGDNTPSLHDQITTDLLLEVLFGKSSEFYKENLNSEIISDGFSFEHFCGRGYSALIFDDETKNYKQAAEAIKNEIKNAKANGIDKELFELARRRLYSKYLFAFDSTDDTVSLLVDSAMNGSAPFEEDAVLKEITVVDIEKRLSDFDEENSSLSVVLEK